MKLNIAANYGGRWDILQATHKLVKKCLEENLNFNELNEDTISQNLSVPTDVDLLIRTGGEKRISNFLMWQSAYAELFSPIHYGRILIKRLDRSFYLLQFKRAPFWYDLSSSSKQGKG